MGNLYFARGFIEPESGFPDVSSFQQVRDHRHFTAKPSDGSNDRIFSTEFCFRFRSLRFLYIDQAQYKHGKLVLLHQLLFL
jgi:hypothetical protein